MKAFLMYRDRDFDLRRPRPAQAEALTQDLELTTLFDAMARDDRFLFDVSKAAVFAGQDGGLDTITYRQHVLRDCLKNVAIVRSLYETASEALESEKKVYWGFFSKYPAAILGRSIEVLHLIVAMLKRLRHVADHYGDQFDSEGFSRFFTMLKDELTDEYFADVERHLSDLTFRGGMLISADVGKGNKGINYILRRAHAPARTWMARLFGPRPPGYTFRIHERDESGARALGELKDRGITLAANALAQSVDHLVAFLTMVRTELGFYVGCLNLHEQLAGMGQPTSFPVPATPTERRHAFEGLYDVCLALTMKQNVVGNDLNADQKDLVVITGANQGGKSTFLRSVGLAQLMMQCGMFVPADSLTASLSDRLFTHYKREEDTTMKMGKLDEELRRMSDIVDEMTPNSLVLFNESFAATNEREGSELARQIVCALLDKGVKVFFVTHLYAFAHHLYSQRMGHAIFLRAERRADGLRTFRLVEGEPLQTSYGEDLYRRIFGGDDPACAAGSRAAPETAAPAPATESAGG